MTEFEKKVLEYMEWRRGRFLGFTKVDAAFLSLFALLIVANIISLFCG